MKYSLAMMAAALLGIVLIATPSPAATTDRTTTSLENVHINNGPIAEILGATNVEIGWSTEKSARMSLRYGTDEAHMGPPVDARVKSRGRNHHVTLDGLKPDTQYFFQVFAGNTPVGEVGTFHTLPAGAAAVEHRVIVP